MLSKVLFTSNPQCDFIGDLNMKIVTIKFSRGGMPMFVFLVFFSCNVQSNFQGDFIEGRCLYL